MSYAAAATGGVPSTIVAATAIPAALSLPTRSKRNIVLTEMKNKCRSNPNTTNANIKKQPSIVERLQACVENERIRDLELIGRDGVRVPALRCVVASASPVLERMLYGEFSEATRSDVEMGDDCSAKALECLVEFCCSDQLTIGRWNGDCCELVEDLMSVARLGHTYAVPGLQEAAQDAIVPKLHDDPSLACLIFEAAHPISTPELHAAALETIRSMPYVALKPPSCSFPAILSTKQEGESHEIENDDNEEMGCGGIVCLSPEKLEEVLQDKDIEAEELFLFQCLVEWKFHNEELYEHAEQICQQIVRHFRLACIDPQDLKDAVMTAGFVPSELILEAFMEQALAAANEGIAFAAFRSPRGPEGGHVLVQGAGFQGCNGIYTQRKDVSYPPLLYYVKPDKKKNVTYYLIKDRTESWKICENTTALYEWKAYNNNPSASAPPASRKQIDDFPQTGWSLPSAAGGLPSAKVKLPVPTCKFFRPRDDTALGALAASSQTST